MCWFEWVWFLMASTSWLGQGVPGNATQEMLGEKKTEKQEKVEPRL